METKHYDAVVIGAGAGGYEAAIELSKGGLKTLLIEKSKEKIGGTCLNEGCIPAKTYLQSAELLLKIKWYEELGVDLQINGFDIEVLKKRSESLKDEIRVGVSWLLDQAKVDCLYGSAIFKDENSIEIDDVSITFDKAIIATGSIVRNDPRLTIDGKFIISSSDVFRLNKLPKSIVIVGGGAIGCEFATFFNAHGVEVTIIIRGEHLVSNQDEEVSKALKREFKKRNINIITSCSILNHQIKDNQVILDIQGENNQTLECDNLLLAIGRVPNTKDLNLESTSVKLDDKGFVIVDESFRTLQKNIYAIGDCIDTKAFAHVAYAEAKVAVNNILKNESQTNNNIIPSVIFTTPQIASCGINEKASGIEIEIKKNYYKANVKSKILGDDSGFMKIIICSKTNHILGVSIVGVEASEIIHLFLLAMDNKIKYNDLKKSIYAHPSVSEIVGV